MTDILNTKKDLNELLPSNILSEIKLENEEENKEEEENEDEIVDVIFYYNYNFIRTLLINPITTPRNIPVEISK